MSLARQPAFYIPHGGGPCFFMDDPRGTWSGMAGFLRGLSTDLPARPQAILMVSAHWESEGFAFTAAERPSLVYDYYGFPPHTYALGYDAPGSPGLAAQAAGLLREAGLAATLDPDRGLDHGVFVPLKVAFPAAEIPVVEMSLDASLDPALWPDPAGWSGLNVSSAACSAPWLGWASARFSIELARSPMARQVRCEG